MFRRLPHLLFGLALAVLSHAALAQMPGGPPSVGVVKAETRPMTEASEFVGRIQAVGRVALTARVTAFLDERLFTEGAEVKEGELLFRLERAPFEAAVQQQEAAVAETSARLANANIQLARAQQLLATPAGQRAAVDDATANQRAAAAQVMAAQGRLRQAQIDLAYTEIRAPIDGKISRAAITVGNVVGPNTGQLASIVSQDPMYVLVPIAARSMAELDRRYADRGGLSAVVVRLRMPDGSIYAQEGKIDYVDPSVAQNTDTITLRARIPNPSRGGAAGQPVDRPLIDGAFVNVIVEGMEPVMALTVPRAAILSDQQGNYVYVIGADNKVEQRRVELGPSTPMIAVVAGGLKEGETVVVEGVQRARPGIQVSPSSVTPGPSVSR